MSRGANKVGRDQVTPEWSASRRLSGLPGKGIFRASILKHGMLSPKTDSVQGNPFVALV